MIPADIVSDLRRQRLKRGPSRRSILSNLESLYVEHPIFQKAVKEVEAALNLHGNASILPNLQISGVSGVGKTTLVEKIMGKYPSISNGRKFKLTSGFDAWCDEIPVLRVDMPVQPSVEALARAFLKAYGDPKHASGDKKSVEERLRIYIYASGTKAFLIDEAQRAVDRNGTIVKQELAFWLQDLHEKNYVSIIIVGLGRTNFLFDQDTQVERRWDSEIRMTPYQWGGGDVEPESRLHFIALLIAFRDNFPIEWPDDLNLVDDDICLKFYYASRGVIGYLKKLLHRLLRIVVSENLTGISSAHFYMAFDLAFRKEVRGGSLQNPFDLKWEPVLPPPLPDDTQLINLPRKRHKKTKGAQKAELTYALTVA